MKLIALALLVFGLSSCASRKIIVKNCEETENKYFFICEKI